MARLPDIWQRACHPGWVVNEFWIAASRTVALDGPPHCLAGRCELVKRAGVAQACSHVNGEFCVHTPTGWETWVEMQQVWPLARLRSTFASPVVERSVEEPTTALPQPTAEELADPVQREAILARLKGRFALPQLRDEAMRWAKEWGFVVNNTGIAEGAGCG